MDGFGAGELFQLLRDGAPRTRSELATATGFSRATISSRIDELLDSGLITTLSDAISTGGRPSGRVALNPCARLVAVADFGATHATVALLDLNAVVLAEKTTHRSIASDPHETLDWFAAQVRELLQRIERSIDDLLSIGIGVPGPVEHATGRPTSPPIMPGWDGFNIPGYLAQSFPVPILVDNDVNVMALGEQAKGWPNVQNLVFVKVATGIGSGIISDGRIQRGEAGSAGDIGHIPTAAGGETVCRCGNIGCLEAIAAAPALIASFMRQGLLIDDMDDVVALSKSGNLQAMTLMRQAGRHIGEVLNACVSILNPALIVIGGALATSNEVLIAGIREAVYSRSMPLATKDLIISPSLIGENAGVYGAAIMAIEYALSPSAIQRSRRKERVKLALE